ncbi:MAG: GTP-binding protein [Planctomycetota bacterium]
MTDISLSICGHAWHGKSTLLGKIVAESGLASPREIETARRQAKEGRDPSLVFAQLVFRSKDVDHKESEAARGVTILPSMVRFQFEQHRVTVIDTPGQETYANNRFFGMFQADCALLVVDVNEGPQPITRQVVRILKGFEIPVMAVVLTKMDRVDYEEEPFRETEELVRKLCDEHGVSLQNTAFIPASAYAPDRDIHAPGEGILAYTKCDWYDGPSVWEFMAKLTYQRIRPAAPARVVIHGSEVYDHVPGIGKTATALVEAGAVRPEMKLQFEPLSAEKGTPVTARVRSVQLTRGHIATPGIPIPEGVPRQLIGIAFKNVSFKESLRELFKGRGVVAGDAADPPRVAQRMMLEMTVFDPDTVLRVGEVWTMHVHVDRAAVMLDRVIAKRTADDDDWRETDEDGVLPTEWARVEVTCTNRPVAIEEAATLPQLSKFVVRHGKKAVAFGRCVKILG